MGKHRFKKPEPSHIRGICVNCNKNLQKKVSGKDKFRALCSGCEDRFYYKNYNKPKPKQQRITKVNYKKFKKNHCEECGFIPQHKCQLDVDHIDGNHFNNDPTNLQTLCANCHRLKTFLNKDGIFK